MLQKLKKAARTAHEERDLPTEILMAIEGIHTLTSPPDSSLPATLLQQLEEYDPYAGTGCFCGGTSLAAIKETVARIA